MNSTKPKMTLTFLFNTIRMKIANMIYQHEIPFNTMYTIKREGVEIPAIPYTYKPLAEFDLPGTDRHYVIYVDRGSNE